MSSIDMDLQLIKTGRRVCKLQPDLDHHIIPRHHNADSSKEMEKDADGFYSASATPTEPAAASTTSVPAAQADAVEHTDLKNSDFEVAVTLADQQADPNSPLYSAKTFEELELHQDLLKGIYDMGFSKPSKIQERALPLLLANPPQNMIGQSQSGTGKTAAFVLTMLSRIDFSKNMPQAICLAPSRELARQIMSVVVAMGKFTPVQTEYAIKDHLPKGVSRVTAQVIVGTPGTTIDLIRRKVIDVSEVKVFVLDEADDMLKQDGLGDQTLRVKNMLPKNHHIQIVLFSATFPEHVRTFANKFAPNANRIELQQTEISVDNIRQFYMDCRDENHKYEVLVSLYSLLTIGQSIIFCRLRHTADRISQRMTAEGHKVASLHGAKDASERDAIIDNFREGRDKVLITTNVIARGIDILQVNMVVNYDLPLLGERGEASDNPGRPDIETYIHRIGRTGRFGRKGISINFVHDKATWANMEAIEKATGKKIIRIETNDLDEMEEVRYELPYVLAFALHAVFRCYQTTRWDSHDSSPLIRLFSHITRFFLANAHNANRRVLDPTENEESLEVKKAPHNRGDIEFRMYYSRSGTSIHLYDIIDPSYFTHVSKILRGRGNSRALCNTYSTSFNEASPHPV
ncbi:P-loop containing nucleoside triphosphate hydrolase protein [Cytidiella melzeri]|nr:P-loop containing nucleoside triphosphate hydrolase protein [Cytidiella melzeri]